MSSAFACVLLQINTRVGDIPGNTAAILAAIEDARSQGADLLVTPELALTGYPPEDLLLRPALMARVDEALLAIPSIYVFFSFHMMIYEDTLLYSHMMILLIMD